VDAAGADGADGTVVQMERWNGGADGTVVQMEQMEIHPMGF
jgi:hypothetical protein